MRLYCEKCGSVSEWRESDIGRVFCQGCGLSFNREQFRIYRRRVFLAQIEAEGDRSWADKLECLIGELEQEVKRDSKLADHIRVWCLRDLNRRVAELKARGIL